MIKKVTVALTRSLDRWRDIGLSRLSLGLVLTNAMMLLAGCDTSCVCHYNDSLSERMAPVKAHFQWDERFQETPTGVTLMVYASNGSLYNTIKSNRTDYAEIFLPQGEFTLVAFNQSLNELQPIWFQGYEKLDNTRILLSSLETPPTFVAPSSTPNYSDKDKENADTEDGPTSSSSLSSSLDSGKEDQTAQWTSIDQTVTETFVYPSPWLALSQLQTLTILQEELMNINTKCSCKVCCCSHLHDAASATHSLTLKLVPQTYTLTVNLRIQNISPLASVKAYLRSLTTGINLRGEPVGEKASITLEQWQKQMTSDSDGIITSKTTSLSAAVTDQSALVIELSLADGKTSMVRILPLKDNFRIDPSTMTVTVDLELPEPLPEVECNVAGAFWVTVTDWGDPTDIDI